MLLEGGHVLVPRLVLRRDLGHRHAVALEGGNAVLHVPGGVGQLVVGEQLDGVVELPLDVGPLVARLGRPRPVHAAREVHDDLGIVLGLRGRLHALDRGAHGAGCALRGARRVELDPVRDGQDDVGRVVLRRVPQVEVHVEVERAEGLPGARGVRLAHEVAGLVPQGAQRIGVARDGGVPHRVAVGPVLPPAQKRELVAADLLEVDFGGRGGGTRRPGAEALQVAVDGHDGGAAVAARGVQVAGDAHEVVEHAAGLDAVAEVLDGQHVLDAAVAVAAFGVEARAVGRGRSLDLLGGDAGDLGGHLGGVLGGAGLVVLPHRLHLHGAAVFERDLELALEGGVDGGIEGQKVGHPALRLAGQQVVLRGLAALARLLGVVVLALPEAARVVDIAFLVGVEPGERAVLVLDALLFEGFPVVVVHEELIRVAALFDVALLEQEGLHVPVRAVGAHGGEAGGLHVLAHEERGVRPFLGVQLVVELLLDDDVRPGQAQRGVGAGAQVLPVVGLFAHVGHARVDADVDVGARRDVDGGAARVVVVGQLRRAAPLHVHLRAADRLHPRHGELRHHGGGEVARALADLPGFHVVRRLEHVLQDGLRVHAPDARRAHLAGDGLAAVLRFDLHEVVDDGLHGLVPADALPSGLLALGIRALHGVVQTVGVVRRLDGRLRLRAAVAHGLERALVAFDADGAPVLDDDLDAALHLAAAAAARLHFHGVLAGNHGIGFLGQRGVRRCAERRSRSAGDGGGFDERASRHSQIAHTPSPPPSSSRLALTRLSQANGAGGCRRTPERAFAFCRSGALDARWASTVQSPRIACDDHTDERASDASRKR